MTENKELKEKFNEVKNDLDRMKEENKRLKMTLEEVN